MTTARMWWRTAATAIIVGGYILLAAGSAELSPARCEISGISTDPDVGIVNGEPDAGYRVSFTLRNTAQTGAMVVLATLSTSEGEFDRQQELTLDAGASRQLRFFFAEPTINADNIQARVNCRP